MREVIAKSRIQSILTEGRAKIENEDISEWGKCKLILEKWTNSMYEELFIVNLMCKLFKLPYSKDYRI